jgi:hypothetical protein
MQDIYCPVCGEPTELSEFHEVEGMTFKQATDKFYEVGCEVVYGTKCEKPASSRQSLRAEASSMLADIMGDDLDGIASGLDDAEYFGMFD